MPIYADVYPDHLPAAERLVLSKKSKPISEINGCRPLRQPTDSQRENWTLTDVCSMLTQKLMNILNKYLAMTI